MSSLLRAAWRLLDRATPLLGIAVIVVGFLIIHSQGSAVHQTEHALAEDVRNQVINRAANVESWCAGINRGRDYDRGFVAHVTAGHVAYRLADLPCEALIRKTLESPKHKDPITAADHPITSRLLQQIKVK